MCWYFIKMFNSVSWLIQLIEILSMTNLYLMAVFTHTLIKEFLDFIWKRDWKSFFINISAIQEFITILTTQISDTQTIEELLFKFHYNLKLTFK